MGVFASNGFSKIIVPGSGSCLNVAEENSATDDLRSDWRPPRAQHSFQSRSACLCEPADSAHRSKESSLIQEALRFHQLYPGRFGGIGMLIEMPFRDLRKQLA